MNNSDNQTCVQMADKFCSKPFQDACTKLCYQVLNDNQNGNGNIKMQVLEKMFEVCDGNCRSKNDSTGKCLDNCMGGKYNIH